MKTNFAILVLLAIICLSGLLKAQTFTKQTGMPFTAVNYGNHKCASFVDINNDGLLDIFFTGSTNTSGTAGFSGIYNNNGNNTFTALTGLPFSSYYGSEADWFDYNNDGFLDLLISGQGPDGTALSGYTRLYKNNGNNTFNQIFSVSRGGCITTGDFNNDGKPDFAIAEATYYNSPFTIKIYKNNGANSFTQDLGIVFPTTTNSHKRIASVDYNNDGYFDIIALRADSALLYKNNGNNTFSKTTNFNLPSTGGSSSLAFTDYNNDGFLDIFKSDGKVYLNNNGNGTFTSVILNTMASFMGGNDWGDYNNDGKPDVLLSGSSPNLSKIYRNDGFNTFTDISATITGISQWSSVKWGDYNNDGYLDFITAGYSDFTGYKLAELYKSNGGGVTNTPPTVPGNLSSSEYGGIVTLTWNAATDNQTNQKALTYNVRIGKTPGGSDIVSAMANSSTGFRKIPQNGNVGTNQLYIIKDLAPGTYYWSV
jgi:hypothetical protein